MKPADKQHSFEARWARPRRISGESTGGVSRCGAGSRPLADGLELLDPAWSVLPGAHGGQRTAGHARGVGTFAQDETDGVVAVAGAPGLALARALVVARAERGPASQAFGRAEASHVVADLDEDQRSGDLVDAGNGLQQAVRRASRPPRRRRSRSVTCSL